MDKERFEMLKKLKAITNFRKKSFLECFGSLFVTRIWIYFGYYHYLQSLRFFLLRPCFVKIFLFWDFKRGFFGTFHQRIIFFVVYISINKLDLVF